MSLQGPGQIYIRGPKGRDYGWMDGVGWDGMEGWMGWDRISQFSFNFLQILLVYSTFIYLIIYIYSKIITNILVGFKNFICQIEVVVKKKYNLMQVGDVKDCFFKSSLFNFTKTWKAFFCKNWRRINSCAEARKTVNFEASTFSLPSGSRADLHARTEGPSFEIFDHAPPHLT